MFIKQCWGFIISDFYAIFEVFFQGHLDLRCLNSSYITLVPKVTSPNYVNDYQPIYLLCGPIKLLTKLLSNMLQKVNTDLIHGNQYAFIRQRTIQDCLGWAFQYLHLCHTSKREIIIMKLDFENAFDKVENHVIVEVMERKMLLCQLVILGGICSLFRNVTSVT
jgi:hypothetical protein